MHIFRLLFVVFWIAMLSTATITANEIRTWTDSTGQFNVEATFVRVDGENVQLQATDGRQITLPLTRLSDADQAYVKRQAGNSRTQTTVPPKNNAGTTVRSHGELPNPVPLQLDSVPQAMPNTNQQWNCPPDPSQVEKMDGVRPFSFSFGNLPREANQSDGGLFFSQNDGKIMAMGTHVVFRSPPQMASNPPRRGQNPGPSTNYTRIWLGNVPTGQSNATDFDDKLVPLGLSPKGRKIALRSDTWEFGNNWGKRKYLYIGDVSGSGIVVNKAFVPFSSVADPNNIHDLKGDIEWAGWISDNLILVQAARGFLILLDVDQGRAVWKWSPGIDGGICLSPGGRYVVVPGSGKIFLLSTVDGKGIGQLDDRNTRGQSGLQFAFSPDGKTIATIGLDGVALWDATTGQTQEPFFIGEGIVEKLQWYDNRYLMAGTRLIDTETKIVLWNYAHHPSNAVAIGGNYWFLPPLSLAPATKVMNVKLPHPKAIQAVQNSTSLLSVAPGMNVALILDNSVQDGREEIQKSMERKFAENGWRLASNAPVTMTLKVTTEPEATVSYAVSQGPLLKPTFRGEETEVKYTPRKYLIEIREGNKVIWTAVTTQHPSPAIGLGAIQNSSLQEFVNKSMAKAEYKNWFLNARIPRTISNPDKAGRSQLTENGIRD